MKKVDLIQNARGQSLIQIMVSVGIMSIIMLVFLSMQSVQQKASLGVQTSVSLNLLQIEMQNSVISSTAMTATLADTDPGNVRLKKCLSGASCATQKASGFYFLNASGTKIAGPGAASASKPNYMYYDFKGAPCTSPSSTCVIQVSTTFDANCPSGVPPCSVTMNYAIEQVPNVIPVGGTLLRTIASQGIALSPTGGGGGGSGNSGLTGPLPNNHSACSYPPPAGWTKMPSGNIGASRNCIAYISSFQKTYRYNSAGCFYNSADGLIYGCSGDNNVVCGYFCTN